MWSCLDVDIQRVLHEIFMRSQAARMVPAYLFCTNFAYIYAKGLRVERTNGGAYYAR